MTEHHSQDPMLNVIHDFRECYEKKMRTLDEACTGDFNLKSKVQQNWIRDLSEQNDMLVRAVIELEQESCERVNALEAKLHQSAQCAMKVISGYKESNVIQCISALQDDIAQLTSFIKRSQIERTWNVKELNLLTTSIDDVSAFDRDSKIQHHQGACNGTKMNHTLKTQVENVSLMQEQLANAIFAKETTNIECKKCAESKQSMMDMRDALTAEVAEKHDTIVTLKRDVQVLEEQCRKAEQQTHFKDDIVKELRKEIKMLSAQPLEIVDTCAVQLHQLEAENSELSIAVQRATERLEMMERRTNYKPADRDTHVKCEVKIGQLEAELFVRERRIEEMTGQLNKQTTGMKKSVACQCEQLHDMVDKSISTSLRVANQGCQTQTITTGSDRMCFRDAGLKNEENMLQEAVNGLQFSVNRMMITENQSSKDKERIAALEMQLSCALHTKESEIETARACRELEIQNLKELIDQLVANLDKEKQRSNNLQSAVDKCIESSAAMKSSESKFKQEVADQKSTIQNLQQALVHTKQHLEDVQQKSAIEVEEHLHRIKDLLASICSADEQLTFYTQKIDIFTRYIQQLLDENVNLEQTLFYNHNDLDICEMRLAKYQQQYKEVEIKCVRLQQQVQFLENEKDDNAMILTDDLSSQLNDCQTELARLFTVVENNGCDCESRNDEEIKQLREQLQTHRENLAKALNSVEQEKNKNAKLAQSLNKKQYVIETLRSEADHAHQKLQEAASKMAYQEQLVDMLEQQIVEHQKTLAEVNSAQCRLEEQLEEAQMQLTLKDGECNQLFGQIGNLERRMEDECTKYNMKISELTENVKAIESNSDKLRLEAEELSCHCHSLADSEAKMQHELLETEKSYAAQINQFRIKQERLVAVVTSLEAKIECMSNQLHEKDSALEALKETVNNAHASLASNERKHKIVVQNVQTAMDELQIARDFLVARNEQMSLELSNVQDVCNAKAASIASLEMELNEARSMRESLCNESQQVIAHVRLWLEEQRKINCQLSQKLKYQDEVIAHLKKLEAGPARGKKQEYCLQVMHSPPPIRQTQTDWSMGSIDSAPCSCNDECEWDEEDEDAEVPDENEDCDEFQQIWIHRVESLTQELQQSNIYWKSKLQTRVASNIELE